MSLSGLSCTFEKGKVQFTKTKLQSCFATEVIELYKLSKDVHADLVDKVRDLVESLKNDDMTKVLYVNFLCTTLSLILY